MTLLHSAFNYIFKARELWQGSLQEPTCSLLLPGTWGFAQPDSPLLFQIQTRIVADGRSCKIQEKCIRRNKGWGSGYVGVVWIGARLQPGVFCAVVALLG